MRFSGSTNRGLSGAGIGRNRIGASIRLAAALAGLLLVTAAISRLERPETHAAIGHLLGETPISASPTPLAGRERLVASERYAGVRDNAPFRSEEQPAWFATIDAVRDADPAALATRSIGLVGYATLSTQPDSYRGHVVTVAGRVRRVEEVTPAENDLGLERLWRVTIEPLGGEVWPITLYTVEQPPAADEPYDASAVGVFFKKLSYRWRDGVGSTPVVVACKVETSLPATHQDTAAVTPAAQPETIDFAKPDDGSMGRALLAELGYDLDQLLGVQDQRPLRADDGPPFYSLLESVGRTPAAQLVRLARAGLNDYVARRAPQAGSSLRDRQEWREIRQALDEQRYSIVPLFGNASRERGELVVVDAVVRRVVWVDASSELNALERGVAGYYELEAFPEDSQNLPVVFVVRDLPAGFPVGEAVRQPARLAGFFFKQWAYRTRKPSGAGDARQFAPLLVGRAPIPIAVPDTKASRPGAALGLLATAGLAATAIAIWRLSRQDRRYQMTTLARLRTDSAPADFDRLAAMAAPVDPDNSR